MDPGRCAFHGRRRPGLCQEPRVAPAIHAGDHAAQDQGERARCEEEAQTHTRARGTFRASVFEMSST